LEYGSAAMGARSAREWARVLSRYNESSLARSLLELIITIGAFVLLWVLMWLTLDLGYWVSLLIAMPTAGFLVRLFLIQHDCGHGSFFGNRRANDWAGRVLGVLTLAPYDFWRRTHAIHHAGSGNLERRGIGEIVTLTVREYQALSWRQRLRYRLYRNPAVLFGLAPAYLFVVRYRFPAGLWRGSWSSWLAVMATNGAIALVIVAAMAAVGVGPFLLVQLPLTLLAATIGVWLFYVQHQFEDTYWAEAPPWTLHEAALHGSSHYDLPRVLRWFTANIGVHHVHHLCSRIPYYRLPEVLRDHPELGGIGRITLGQSLRCARLVLWDEEQRRLISFREFHCRNR
jgi:acyl-lipid omega-6 desaturase (Delta-12 desaturase)